MGDQAKRIAEILSAFGLGSIFVVVIGRLWTLSYFKHFGLSTGDLEFTTQDFAFRSLEVLVSLSLAGLALLVAFRVKTKLQCLWWPFLAVIAVAAGVSFIAFLERAGGEDWFLDNIVNHAPWLTRPGIFGVISGGALIILIFLVAEIWKQVTPVNVPWLPRRFLGNQLVAVSLMLGIVFVYLPLITTNLAKLDARLDLRTDNLPVAILETSEGPLPDAIASDEDPTKSNLVRVILAQSGNTYVLNSTQCDTIGEPGERDQLERTKAGKIISQNANLCKVFAIPTSRLKSVEYRSVTGNPPSNDTPRLAAQIGLREPFEPFEATLSTEGATDGGGVKCLETENKEHSHNTLMEYIDVFRNTVWYEITAPHDGYLAARVDSLEAALVPVIGVWPGSKGAVLERDAAPGSGHAGRACETISVDLPEEDSGELDAEEKSQRVGVIANLQRDQTYFIGIGARDDAEGSIHVFLQFIPDGALLAATQEDDLLPTIELPSTLGRVELELRRFDKDYDLAALLKCEELLPSDDGPEICLSDGGEGVIELLDDEGDAVTFSLESEDGATVTFTLVQDGDDDPERTTLEARGLLGAGAWRLITPGRFEILASLTIPTLQPNLILAFDDRRDDPDVRRFLTHPVVLNPAEIRAELQLEGAVVFDHEFLDAPAPAPQEENDTLISDEEWSKLVTFIAALSVDVAAVEQGQQSPEVQSILRNAAKLVQTRLERVGVKVTVRECKRMCIRIFFISVQPKAMAESDVLSPEEPPPNGQDTVPSE